MENRNRSEVRAEYITKLVLSGVFLGGLGLFVWRQQSAVNGFQPTAIDLIFLAFATLRLGRLIAYDLVMEPIRAPFAHSVPDGTGAGESVEPTGKGAMLSLGQLITCPICAGTWVAAVLVIALYSWPGPTRVFIAALGTIGIAELLNSVVEALCWTGQENRARAGVLLRKTQKKANKEANPKG